MNESEGIAAVHTALELGINYFDVAPLYGGTRAETVLGRALRGVARDRFYLSTKVGKYTSPTGYGADTFDYSRDRIRASLDESAARLGVDYFDIVHLHDIEYQGRRHVEWALKEGIEALQELRREGRVGAVSFGIHPMDLWHRIFGEYDVQGALVHNHYCLLRPGGPGAREEVARGPQRRRRRPHADRARLGGAPRRRRAVRCDPRRREDAARQQRAAAPLGALGGFGDPALATRALALTLSPEFVLRDAGALLRGVFDTRETRATGLAFVEAHADELLARMRDDEATWFLSGLAQAPCDQPTLDRLTAIVTPRSKKYGAAEASVTRGLELSKQCIQTMQRQLPALRAFLK